MQEKEVTKKIEYHALTISDYLWEKNIAGKAIGYEKSYGINTTPHEILSKFISSETDTCNSIYVANGSPYQTKEDEETLANLRCPGANVPSFLEYLATCAAHLEAKVSQNFKALKLSTSIGLFKIKTTAPSENKLKDDEIKERCFSCLQQLSEKGLKELFLIYEHQDNNNISSKTLYRFRKQKLETVPPEKISNATFKRMEEKVKDNNIEIMEKKDFFQEFYPSVKTSSLSLGDLFNDLSHGTTYQNKGNYKAPRDHSSLLTIYGTVHAFTSQNQDANIRFFFYYKDKALAEKVGMLCSPKRIPKNTTVTLVLYPYKENGNPTCCKIATNIHGEGNIDPELRKTLIGLATIGTNDPEFEKNLLKKEALSSIKDKDTENFKMSETFQRWLIGEPLQLNAIPPQTSINDNNEAINHINYSNSDYSFWNMASTREESTTSFKPSSREDSP